MCLLNLFFLANVMIADKVENQLIIDTIGTSKPYIIFANLGSSLINSHAVSRSSDMDFFYNLSLADSLCFLIIVFGIGIMLRFGSRFADMCIENFKWLVNLLRRKRP